MRLTEILERNCVRVPLAATDKQAAIHELVDLLARQTAIQDAEALKQAVWQREQTRTTGIGHGIGIPHGKSPTVDKLRMAIGKPAEPIEFNAIDKKPVDLILLLVSPTDQTGPHIQALARISRILTDDDFRAAVKATESSDALYDLIAEHEAAATA